MWLMQWLISFQECSRFLELLSSWHGYGLNPGWGGWGGVPTCSLMALWAVGWELNSYLLPVSEVIVNDNLAPVRLFKFLVACKKWSHFWSTIMRRFFLFRQQFWHLFIPPPPQHVDNLTSLWNCNFKFHMHVVCGHGPLSFNDINFKIGRLAAILEFFSFQTLNFSLALNIKSKLQ